MPPERVAVPAVSKIPLTIIIPVFERQQQLQRALESILEQQVYPKEVIVVDDASTPSMTVTPTFSGLNIRLLRRDKNGGPAAARNVGLAACQTEWCSFLDSDDELVPNTLDIRWEMLIADQTRHHDPRVIYGCGWVDRSTQREDLQVRWPEPSRHIHDFASGCWFSPGSCILLNRVVALESAGFQDDRLRRLEDFDWFLALGTKGFRLQPQHLVGTLIERRRCLDPRFVEENARLLKQKWRASGLSRQLLRRAESYLLLECASAYFYAGERRTSFLRLLRSFVLHPRLRLHHSPGWQLQSVDDYTIHGFRST